MRELKQKIILEKCNSNESIENGAIFGFDKKTKEEIEDKFYSFVAKNNITESNYYKMIPFMLDIATTTEELLWLLMNGYEKIRSRDSTKEWMEFTNMF